MTPQIIGLFAEPVARYRVWPGDWQQVLTAEPMELRQNHSYSRDQWVLDKWPRLRSSLELCAQTFARDVMAFVDRPEITQSWINVYEKSQWIHQHNHPNSMISGTWYWQLDQEAEILFHRQGVNPPGTWQQKFDRDPQRSTEFSIDTVSVRVQEGDLLVWPSYLQHSVPAWQGTEPRGSLSFNLQPRQWGSDLYSSRRTECV